MGMEYIRKHYKVPAKRGSKVIYTGGEKPQRGVITSAVGAHIMVRLEGTKKSEPFHPTWKLEYAPKTCEGHQGSCTNTEGIEYQGTRTAYADEKRNVGIWLCPECAEGYHEYWDEMWSQLPGMND